jgi:hypothetical protein
MLVGIRASLRVVLDLTDPAHVHTLLDLEELLLEDWRKTNGERMESRSQALGRAVTDLRGGDINALSYSEREEPCNLPEKPKAGEQDRSYGRG